MAPYKINDRALSWVPPEQIEEQALELVDVVHTFRQIVNVKGA